MRRGGRKQVTLTGFTIYQKPQETQVQNQPKTTLPNRTSPKPPMPSQPTSR
ncbi:hypothetical protein FD14_GL001263 [Secundilactobacillus similis DSM 23365 = JCM 2765]|uniref:Uncharacterized protein n=1 Tax=Secundilactobacillus similis DSM 23365 = JCM 2765 TaxID=1423804 RepID=A0A0R2EZT2_9LACO|nr:hypothetical protein FD14_GL001263 [Secundilactobacillus similis DSM 23365 = JCM 2765]